MSGPRRLVEARAHAKINLCLAVSPAERAGGPRAGWHRIASWFAPVELWDDVRVERLDGREGPPGGSGDAGLSPCHPSHYTRRWAADAPRPSPIDWPEDKDLAVRAHRLLETDWQRLPLPVRVEIEKRIPTGGGLGGGSSDAAAVLRAVTMIYGLPLPGPALRRLAARLGSDVPYFIPDGTLDIDLDRAALLDPPAPALVRGFGDDIRPGAQVRGPLTLILPDFGCPTPAVYRAFDALPAREFRDADVSRLASPSRGVLKDPGAVSGELFNDLTEAAIRVEPRLGEVMSALRAAGHRPHLSGSGSTVFVLGDAQVAAPPGCIAVRTRFASAPRA
jgi:4-diphosphocytidyl-2-C-methyl-D-erythritol kinase